MLEKVAQVARLHASLHPFWVGRSVGQSDSEGRCSRSDPLSVGPLDIGSEPGHPPTRSSSWPYKRDDLGSQSGFISAYCRIVQVSVSPTSMVLIASTAAQTW